MAEVVQAINAILKPRHLFPVYPDGTWLFEGRNALFALSDNVIEACPLTLIETEFVKFKKHYNEYPRNLTNILLYTGVITGQMMRYKTRNFDLNDPHCFDEMAIYDQFARSNMLEILCKVVEAFDV
jgi:hypothetical protein